MLKINKYMAYLVENKYVYIKKNGIFRFRYDKYWI